MHACPQTYELLCVNEAVIEVPGWGSLVPEHQLASLSDQHSKGHAGCVQQLNLVRQCWGFKNNSIHMAGYLINKIWCSASLGLPSRTHSLSGIVCNIEALADQGFIVQLSWELDTSQVSCLSQTGDCVPCCPS